MHPEVAALEEEETQKDSTMEADEEAVPMEDTGDPVTYAWHSGEAGKDAL